MKFTTILTTGLFLALHLPGFGDDVKTLEIGQPAPDFTLPAIDGRSYGLKDFEDAEILAIIFTANHCPTAQAYEDRLIQMSDDFKERGVALVAISSNHPEAVCLEELGYSDLGDHFAEMKIRARDKQYNFVYLYDGDKQEVALAYGPQATPHVFIFDQARKLRYVGRIDDMENPYRKPNHTDARDAIEALLAGKPVPVPSTKVFGCSMKWLSKVAWRQKLDVDWAARPVSVTMLDSSGVVKLVQNDSDKLRLINVWATWCGPCVIEFPELVVMQRMYGKRAFEVVSVSADKPAQHNNVLNCLQENHAAFPNYHFEGSDMYALISAVDSAWQGALPYTLLVAPGGEVIYRQMGIIDPLEVKKKIVTYLGRYYADEQ
jgi:peroxiredoxin